MQRAVIVLMVLALWACAPSATEQAATEASTCAEAQRATRDAAIKARETGERLQAFEGTQVDTWEAPAGERPPVVGAPPPGAGETLRQYRSELEFWATLISQNSGCFDVETRARAEQVTRELDRTSR